MRSGGISGLKVIANSSIFNSIDGLFTYLSIRVWVLKVWLRDFRYLQLCVRFLFIRLTIFRIEFEFDLDHIATLQQIARCGNTLDPTIWLKNSQQVCARHPRFY